VLFKKFFFNLKYFDWQLLIVSIILISFGLAALYSVALGRAEQNLLNFKKQLVFFAAGFVLLLFFSLFDYRFFKVYSLHFYIVSVLSLLFVLFFGKTLRGTRGWFSFFGLNIQPVEIAKIALIVILSNFLSHYAPKKETFGFVFLSGLIAGILFLLVILQPDLGSAVIIFLIWFLMMLACGIKKKYVLAILILISLISAGSWFLLFKDYQKERIMTFLDPSRDPYGRGYQVKQAVTAVGAGGFLGRGLGFGSQSQLKFLPAAQTDFIFAVIAEELGLFGIFLLLLFFGIFFYRISKISKNASSDFGIFLALGAGILFFVQFFINIGMNLGIMPVTGISLPFLSYGGSFLISSLVLVGILESIAVRNIKYRA